MIGIYQDSFLNYLKDNLGDNIKVTGKNIICPCPYCEYNKVKDHYHMYISLTTPIFHCFGPECHKSGIISKLIEKISGKDVSEKYIDLEEIKKLPQTVIKSSKFNHDQKELKFPEIDEDKFKLKSLYLKQRFRFNQMNLNNLKGLIFDVDKFLEINNVPIDPKLFKLKEYLHNNFVGFTTEHNSIAIFRNIDPNSSFRYYKISIYEPIFSDYYKLFGGDYNSNIVVVGEGIFDIMLEHIFDSLKIRDKAKLYAAGLHTFYDSLCKSLVFYEDIFRLNVHVLSDNGINLDYYKKLKRFNNHIIDSITVYYNGRGKDFADVPASIEKFIL
jgi:hypothetical protein